jgi:hypothetical protein
MRQVTLRLSCTDAQVSRLAELLVGLWGQPQQIELASIVRMAVRGMVTPLDESNKEIRMNIVAYKIAVGHDQWELEIVVGKMMGSGWKPLGGVSVHGVLGVPATDLTPTVPANLWWSQAMVQYEAA